VTPPPMEEFTVEQKHMPAPLLVHIPAVAESSRKPAGLSLQIVNPESLGVTYDNQKRIREDGQGSPVTPWEGQLKALVRYVAIVVHAVWFIR
jgi:hypothetical protein